MRSLDHLALTRKGEPTDLRVGQRVWIVGNDGAAVPRTVERPPSEQRVEGGVIRVVKLRGYPNPVPLGRVFLRDPRAPWGRR